MPTAEKRPEPQWCRRPKRLSRWRASGPRTSTWLQVQDTEVGHEIMHLAECGFCKDGEQEGLDARR